MDSLGSGGPPTIVPGVRPLELTYEEVADGEIIGQGGSADVFRVTVQRDGASVPVAVKQPRFQGTVQVDVVDRFLQEADIWAELDDNDHIVGLLDWGGEPLPWLAMEYMDRGTLADIPDGQRLPLDQALWVGVCVCRAVHHAHRHGVAHHDIKPGNVLFRSTPDGWAVPKVSDWGLARLILEETGSVEGLSPRYAAPEQFDADRFGSPDDRTDIYQVGTLVYDLVTGHTPFQGSATAVMQGVLSEEPPPPSQVADVPGELDEMLAPALRKEPGDRYESVLYLRDRLQSLFDSVSETASRTDSRPAGAAPAGGRSTAGGSSAGAASTAGAPGDGRTGEAPTSPADDSPGRESEPREERTEQTAADSSADSTGGLPIPRRSILGILGLGAVGVGGWQGWQLFNDDGATGTGGNGGASVNGGTDGGTTDDSTDNGGDNGGTTDDSGGNGGTDNGTDDSTGNGGTDNGTDDSTGNGGADDGGDNGTDDSTDNGGDNGGSMSPEEQADSYLNDNSASGYGGTDDIEDMTGEDSVTIEVGPDGETRFAPAAARISSGTTVTWEWLSDGHSVEQTDSDLDFEDAGISNEGATHEQTLDSSGVLLYQCGPHQAIGHHGALIVE